MVKEEIGMKGDGMEKEKGEGNGSNLVRCDSRCLFGIASLLLGITIRPSNC